MLSTLARTATRRPLTVIALWVLFLLLGFGLGTGVFGRLSDNVPEVPGTESEAAAEYLDRVDRPATRSPPSSRAPPSPTPRCGPRSNKPSPTYGGSPGWPPYRTRTRRPV